MAFDGIKPRQEEMYLDLLSNMKDNGLLNRVLISQDAGWYTVGEKNVEGLSGGIDIYWIPLCRHFKLSGFLRVR